MTVARLTECIVCAVAQPSAQGRVPYHDAAAEVLEALADSERACGCCDIATLLEQARLLRTCPGTGLSGTENLLRIELARLITLFETRERRAREGSMYRSPDAAEAYRDVLRHLRVLVARNEKAP